MNKNEIITVLLILFDLTTFGLIVDSDPKNPNVWTTVTEYILMLIATFTIITILSFFVIFTFKKVKKMVA